MAQTRSRYCPRCEQTQEFTRSASTTMELGTKTKWRCPDCGYSVVDIASIEGTAIA